VLPEELAGNTAVATLDARFPSAILEAKISFGEVTLQLDRSAIVPLCLALRDEFSFERLSSVTAVDWWPTEPRFEIVYHLHSIKNNSRLRLKLRASERDEIDSVTHVWPGANWYEREVFDLFGISFRNHPNLERIMMPADWEGHPLRKDYPVHGYKYSYANEE
jgi:NADH-quinone oxidoreductase subunit C